MEIEIGGRSEKSLGGQESAAVDQECMGSNARSCSFALSFQIRLPFFLPEPVSCRGQRIARSNGKRNRSFTKNITTFAAVVEVLILIAMFFFFFFLKLLSIAVQAHLKWQLLPGDRPQGRGAVSCFLFCLWKHVVFVVWSSLTVLSVVSTVDNIMVAFVWPTLLFCAWCLSRAGVLVFPSLSRHRSIAFRSICVHHKVPGYIDQNVFGLQRTAKKNGYHFMKNCNASTHQPAHRKICLTLIISVHRHALLFYFFSLLLLPNTSSLILWCSYTEQLNKIKVHLWGSG